MGWSSGLITIVVMTLLRMFAQYLIAFFCSRQKAASDIISGRFVRLTVPDMIAQNFIILALTILEKCGPSRQRRHFFDRFSNFDKCRPEVAGGAMSSVAIYKVGLDVHAKLGDSRLNSS